MKLSNRITTLNGGGSNGWEIFEKARDMIAAGEPVTMLTIGEHDIGTSREILEAMHEAALGGHTGYAAIPGTPALRETVAKRVEARTGVPTTSKNVLIVPGGQSGLFASHFAAVNPGDRALHIDPYYATYPRTLRAVGAEPVAVPARAENGFQPTYEDIAAKAQGATSLLINSPNNPTGAVYSPETLAAIAKACQDFDLWLISDEVYETQVWDGDHISPRSLPGMEERTIVVNSLSKSHAMTGSRIGWIVAPEAVISELTELVTNTTYGVTGYVQDAAQFALNQGDSVEKAVAEPFLRRRGIVQNLVENQNVAQLVPAQGAMYVMLDIRATGMSGKDFASGLLDEELIAVMPGESFGQAAAGHLRIALTVDDDRLEDAIVRLLAFAKARV
ncbi:pyridoxal phosphate-dependent aminotransferase [Cognatishimia activa]|uniref:Aminotransferase n=1 Tax=Cognatishimia activa TaxID=1715691 RepID=A0A975I831_9RHOB|nr:aminotransferase class I/II-fold pyridoxal phosphate-dependent enzyme [Cognatishimia activa]QTN35471.1 aminotransferase class I/II-fold pyridoxal phosphate-dependent enzyme [Cognatishimia activa]